MMFKAILVALVVTAAVATPTIPISTTYYGSICDGCECRKLTDYKLLVSKCKPPLTLSAQTFKNVTRKDGIHVVSIDDAYIQSIASDTFEHFKSLEDVVIKNTKIGSIAPTVFDRISKVSFTNCAFEDDPNLSSKRLEELKMVKCQLSTVPKFDLEKLISLNLSDNSIANVGWRDFERMQEVEDIDLSHNNIETIPADAFINKEELSTLTLDYNPLKEFVISTNNSIELLSLKGCKLTGFNSSATKYLDELSELYLNENDINAIFGIDLAHLKELQILDVSNNKLTVLEPDVFENNTKLEKIILDGNQLKFLPMFMSAKDVPFRTYLFSCNNCGLSSYIAPLVFNRMSALFQLRLANNELEYINGTFDKILSLASVDLSNNKLSSIPDEAFVKNTRLETVILNGNSLPSLNAAAFANLHNLDRIEADDNLMTTLWSNKEGVQMPTVKALSVQHNLLKTISNEELEVTPHLSMLGLNGNELDCHQLITMITWLSKMNVAPPHLTHMEMRDSLGLIDSPSEGSLWRNLTAERCPDLVEALDLLDNEINKQFSDDKDIEKITKEYDLAYANAQPVTKMDDDLGDDYTDEMGDDDEDESDDDEDDDEEDEDEDDDEATIKPIIASIEEVESVRYASYILSLTTVFVLTALMVLFVAVTVTLLILKKNGSINMHTANIPRFKIPTWSQTTGMKKHSGSVYRPLSEDLSPPTPYLKKYEFASSPQVHSLP